MVVRFAKTRLAWYEFITSAKISKRPRSRRRSTLGGGVIRVRWRG